MPKGQWALPNRLAPFGWRDLLLAHGLDITATNLKQELTKELPNINRNIPGFEDFAGEGKRGIEPGNPARSLLFHAFGSPNVVLNAQSTNSQAYPTLAELEIIENFVYGVQPPSLQDLQVRAQGQLLAIVVFASEYRPGSETVHRKHADVCFSRTGVARVGTAEPLYDAQLRGFLPFVEGDVYAFRVLPARYSAYIAVQRRGNRGVFGPMRFQPGDNTNQFWVPLHKLFNGRECIRGLNLQVTLNARHVSEKLRRIHLELRKTGWNTGWSEPDISKPPFIITEGIAELTTKPDFGSGLVVPVVHENIVEAATYQGKPLTFRVPPGSSTFSSSLSLTGSAPAFVHARHVVLPNGEERNLNDLEKVEEAVAAGNYNARHYLDFTGDGSVEALCPELAVAIPRRVPAYSLVTAPDFFPNCDQRELLEWTEQSVPEKLRENLWQTPPNTLSDNRFAPNVQLKGANFRPEDNTVTAIVSLPLSGAVRQMPLNGSPTMRHAYLPDAASGVFAPGWDVSIDDTQIGQQQVTHLAAYRLGSPFQEDAKLCAALSTFWPAVAPDAARTFAPSMGPTVSPLTDEEIGQVGNSAWDGVPGPQRVTKNGKDFIEYVNFAHADYVENSLQKKFSLSLTGQVDVREYEARVLAMANVYRVIPEARGQWNVFSFRQVQPTDSELQQAQTQTGTTLLGSIYRFEIYRPGELSANPDDFRKQLVEIQETVTLFVTPLNILLKRNNGAWERAQS